MKYITLLCLSVLLSIQANANDLNKYLINPPQEINIGEECFSQIDKQANQLKNFVLALRKVDLMGAISIAQPISSGINFNFKLDSINLPDQGYLLSIQDDQVSVTGHSLTALYYAKQTILQLLEYAINEWKASTLSDH